MKITNIRTSMSVELNDDDFAFGWISFKAKEIVQLYKNGGRLNERGWEDSKDYAEFKPGWLGTQGLVLIAKVKGSTLYLTVRKGK